MHQDPATEVFTAQASLYAGEAIKVLIHHLEYGKPNIKRMAARVLLGKRDLVDYLMAPIAPGIWELCRMALSNEPQPTSSPPPTAPPTPPMVESQAVYIIRAGTTPWYKIGVATNTRKRLSALQTSNPERLELICTIPASEAFEHELHHKFRDRRGCGEWFALTADDLAYLKELPQSVAAS